MQLFTYLSRYSLAISICILTLSFITFYPSKYISIDEHEYLSNSYRMIDNNLVQECDESIPAQYSNGEKCVSKYNLGTSFFYIPVLESPILVYFIPFLFFILGLFFFNKTLKLMGIDPIFTFLYTFYPAFQYYSRTLFSETFSIALISIIAYLLFKITKEYKWHYALIIGILTGMSVLIRYTNILPIAILVSGVGFLYFRENIKTLLKSVVGMFLGGLPFLILFFFINQTLYGGILKNGYSLSGEEIFLFQNLLTLLPKYGGVLLLVYPLMLVSFIWSDLKERFVLILASVSVMILYSLYPAHAFENRLLDLVLAIRFIVVIIPLLLLIYASALNNFIKFRFFKILFIILICFGSCLTLILNYMHSEFLKTNEVEWNIVRK